MNVWWDTPHQPAEIANETPVLIPDGRAGAIRALQDRLAGFVPEWRDLSDEDAGVALVRLFGSQIEPILARANRLPEKALVEFLRTAGLSSAPARSATTLIAFTPESANVAPVSVPLGTRLSSDRADDGDGLVTWETDDTVVVPNAELVEIVQFDGEVATPVQQGEPFAAFQQNAIAGTAALYLGFGINGDAGTSLSLGVITADKKIPAAVAAVLGLALELPGVISEWEALTDSGFKPVARSADTSAGLKQSGVLQFTLPRNWIADRPDVLGAGDPMYWLRLRLTSGQANSEHTIAKLMPHAITATAKETLRDAFPLTETIEDQITVNLRQSPVLSGSVVLEVDEGPATASLFELAAQTDSSQSSFRRWSEVATLAGQRSDARVFTLDSLLGRITFGNDIEGMQPPPGIRNIAIREYAITLGLAGNVDADAINRLPRAIPGIASATNPVSANGGANSASTESTVLAGPAMIKARGRAVSASDAALLARFSTGANVLKAYALGGIDVSLDGAERPGTVSIIILPQRHPAEPHDQPPKITSQTLSAVAQHMAENVGPLGSRIVAAAPHFQIISVHATILVTPGSDVAKAEAAARLALDTVLNPELSDWQIGSTVFHANLLQAALDSTDAITAISFLAIAIDGIALAACEDAPLVAAGLPWPGQHRLITDVQDVAL